MGYVSSVSSDVAAYEPVSLSGQVTFSGLGNGTDFQEIIDATINGESYRKDAYETRLEETNSIIDLLGQLQDEIDGLNETLDEMDEPDEFYEMTGTSSDSAVGVGVTGEASEGIHTIIVDQLAQNDVWMATGMGYSDSDEVVTTSATTLELSYGGETLSVDVAAGTTLSGLVSAVNNSVSTKNKVEADLIYDGSAYYFVLRGEDEGADNAISITDTGTLTMDTGSFVNTQTAQNSKIKVDGFPTEADAWIERDSNSIDDVVDGVTFELMETTDSEGVRVSVSYDTDNMADKIATFVASVNQIIYDMQILTGRVEADDDEEVFTIDNSALDIMYNQIKNVLSSSALGFVRYSEEDGGDLFNALSQIGISTDAEQGSDTFGQLVLDEDELADALTEDPEAVALLFSNRAVGESDSEDLQVASVIDTITPAGEHTVKYTVSGGELVSATIDGEEAKVEGWNILGTGSKSTGLYVTVVDQTDGSREGSVRVKQGKVGELSDALSSMIDENTGTLPILITYYEQSATSLDNQIYNEEKRLDILETTLNRKYAALDALLIDYSGQQSTLETLIAELD